MSERRSHHTSTLPSEQPGYARLARFLGEEEQAIVEAWMGFVGERVASHSLDSEELEDAIRSFLAHVRDGVLQGHQKAAPAAFEHGQQRYEVGFHLASMVAEYGLLLQAVEKVAGHCQVEFGMAEFAALASQVVAGVADATNAFVDRQRAERDAQARRHFGFIAHELRNPIQNMAIAVEALHEDDGRTQALGVLERGLTRVRDLVDRSLVDVQQHALLDSGPQAVPERFDFMALVRDVIAENEGHGRLRGIQVALAGPDTLSVALDRSLLHSVVTNLVRNGIKFSCDASTVRVRVRERSDRLHLEIEDRCGGLPEGQASLMFEPFAQMGSDRSGFGLGLAIAHQAVSAHHGRIQAHGLDEGCVFVVDLPLILEAS